MENESGRKRDHDIAQRAEQQQTSYPSPGATAPPPVVPPSAAAPQTSATPPVLYIAVPPRAPMSPTSPQYNLPSHSTLSPIPAAASHTVPSQPVPRSHSDEDGHFNPEARLGNERDHLGNLIPPLPIGMPTAVDLRFSTGGKTIDSHQAGGRPRSEVDWIVPVEEKPVPRRTIGERLEPTVAKAIMERDKFAMKSKMTGSALNVAIGLQVLLGSLTTGFSAAATTGRQVTLATAILGGLSTLVAGYVARARGSKEPELSTSRMKDLEQFIRECQAFQLDNGHVTSNEHDEYLLRLRSRFEQLLGNASSERKSPPPV